MVEFPAFRSIQLRLGNLAMASLPTAESSSSLAIRSLSDVASAVMRRSQQNGFVTPNEIRGELIQLGLSPIRWKEIVDLVKPALTLRHGKYYYLPAQSPTMQVEQKRQQDIHQSIKRLVRHYKKAARLVERRGSDRHDFIETVTVQAEDGKEHRLLSRDLSPSGIRLIGTKRLLGQKVLLTIPDPTSKRLTQFVVRILWTCAVGDDLFENGGRFLEIKA